MSMTTDSADRAGPRPRRRQIVLAAVVVAVLAAIALDTTVVHIGSDRDVRQAGFSPESFGASEFPKVKAFILEKAVDAPSLAAAIAADKAAAIAKYGVAAGNSGVFPVTFTGVAGEAKSGIYTVAVPGLPDGVGIRLQTGPAINGTDLRDATGLIQFGQFTNQIEYQNAGSALNNEMKKDALASVDTANLTGKTIKVVGVFRLVNPKNWLVTPVRLEVE